MPRSSAILRNKILSMVLWTVKFICSSEREEFFSAMFLASIFRHFSISLKNSLSTVEVPFLLFGWAANLSKEPLRTASLEKMFAILSQLSR